MISLSFGQSNCKRDDYDNNYLVSSSSGSEGKKISTKRKGETNDLLLLVYICDQGKRKPRKTKHDHDRGKHVV